jgi:hypothetical protein
MKITVGTTSTEPQLPIQKFFVTTLYEKKDSRGTVTGYLPQDNGGYSARITTFADEQAALDFASKEAERIVAQRNMKVAVGKLTGVVNIPIEAELIQL